MIEQLKPVQVPDDFCYWIHPALKAIDPLYHSEEERWYTGEEWKKLQVDGGVEIKIETHEYWDIPDIPEQDCADWSNWKPKPPADEYFLVQAYDYEDGAVLWWAKAAQEIQ